MDDRTRWNAKHRDALAQPPDPFVLRMLDRVPAGGRALDLAAGTGRHALELARRGFAVEAWDVSDVGLAILAGRAADAGLAVTTRQVDLQQALPVEAPARFDLVVIVDYLERALLPALASLTFAGGHLVFTTFTSDWPGEHPPAIYRLRRDELVGLIPGFATVHHESGGGRAGILARHD